MKRLLTTSICFMLFLILRGQECEQDLIPKQGDNRMWGYVNLMDDWVVLPQYHKVQPFRGKAALVQRGKSYGAIDCNGKAVIQCEYELIQPFIANKAWVKKNGKWGLFSDIGEKILNPIYDEVQPIASYRDEVWVRKGELWGLFDLGSQLFYYQPQFSEYLNLNEVALVKKGNKSGMVSTRRSEEIYPFVISHAKGLPKERIAIKVDSKWGMITEKGERVIPPQFDTLMYFGYNDFKVKKEEGELLYDAIGKKMTAIYYDKIYPFSEGRARVEINGKYGFITVLGRELVSLIYLSASDYRNNTSIVQTERGYGLLGKNNELVLKDTLTQIYKTNNDKYLIAEYKGVEYVIYDNELFNHKYLSVDSIVYKDRLLLRDQESNWMLVYVPTQKVLAKGYDSIRYSGNDRFLVSNAKYGMIDINGTEILHQQFDAIATYHDFEQLVCSKNGNKYIYTRDGELWMNKAFDNVRLYNDQTTLVVTEGESSYFVRNKKVISEAFSEVMISENTPEWPAIVQQGKKMKLIVYSGKSIEGSESDELKYLSKNYYAFRKKRKWGVKDNRGRIVLDAKYDAVVRKVRNSFVVEQKGKEVTVNQYSR